MRAYSSSISLAKNARGIYSLDTILGCSSGMDKNPKGCFGDCYAARYSKKYGYDFSKNVLRYFDSPAHRNKIVRQINNVKMPFIRMGTSGDASEDWVHTLIILKAISKAKKNIVIITKHWNNLTNNQLKELSKINVTFNTSISVLDDDDTFNNGLEQYERIKPFVKSILRVVTCDFNKKNLLGLSLHEKQKELYKKYNFIDTALRVSKNNDLVKNGIINISEQKFLGKKCNVSKNKKSIFMGKCSGCKEMCGKFMDKKGLITKEHLVKQLKINI